MNTVLVACVLLAAQHTPVPTNRGYYMEPTIRGNTIVFVSQGDLWEVSARGGTAHPLTSHVAPASAPHISPDGKSVGFTSTYEGQSDTYVLPLDGDLPKRLTYGEYTTVQGWTPGGKVLVSTRRFSGLVDERLETIDPLTLRHSIVPLDQASQGAYDPSGKTLFFTRLPFQGSHTKRYRGGFIQDLWKYTEGLPEAIPLTADFLGTSKNPMWWNGRVYFISDRDGTMNIWSMDQDGKNLKQLTHSVDWDIQSASLDAGKIVYQVGADLALVDVATGESHVLDITLASDFDQLRDRWIENPMEYLTKFSPSPDGKKVVLTARGQVFVAPVESGRLVEASHVSGVRYRDAMFTSDGKSILALSDQTGETEWWKLPVNGVGAGEQLTSGAKVLATQGVPSPDGKRLAYGDKNCNLWILDIAAKTTKLVAHSSFGTIDGFRWSPDSQWLAYVFPTETFSQIYLYSLATGLSTPATSDRFDSSNPAWSADGKWLYFLSDRVFRSLVGSPWGDRGPEPFFDHQTRIYALALVKAARSPFDPDDELTEGSEPKKPSTGPVKVEVELDGLVGRLFDVPVPAGNYDNLQANSDRLFVQSFSLSGPPQLLAVDIKNSHVSPLTLAGDVSGYELSQDGKALAVRKGGRLSSLPAAAGPGTPDQPYALAGWSFYLHPQEEWRQMFDEAWRLERDYFYDTKMHSVDWPAVRARYRPLVDRVRDRDELSNLLGQMVGELSALHTFVYGGDERQPRDSVSVGYLGADVSREEKLGGFMITRIYAADPDYPESLAPVAKPSVDLHVSDVILSVNGVDALSAPDLSALLRNQVGKQVLLSVKEAKTGHTRQCIVTPIDASALIELAMTDWELSRRRTVDRASQHQIGYLHLRAMGPDDIATWTRDFYPVFNRSGLIIDVRHNHGGNIDSWIIEKLLRKAWFYWQPRVGSPYWNMQTAFRGHVVVLCDQQTASDGEAFTEGIKRLKLGTVIGKRTWGGEIWLSSSNVLEDGGIATAAEMGVYGPEGQWLIEGHGVDPDITVDNLPHATYEGQDAQLEAAIAYLTKEIREHPVPVPPAPKYPDKSFHPKPLR